MKKILKKCYKSIPSPIKRILYSIRLKDRILIQEKKQAEKQNIQRIQKKDHINVTFFAMTVSFWKYDDLFLLLQKDPRFNPNILLVARPIDPPNIQEYNLNKMELYFKEKKFPFSRKIEELNPDIIFYAQPYKNSVPENLRAYNFPKQLLCYVPYAFFISNYTWAYDTLVHNLAWKLFYPTHLHHENAKQIALNKGTNVEVVGYPLADKFLTLAKKDPWKIKDRNVKRIIWGVHHSILSDDLADCGTFLKYSEYMLDFASKHTNCQFAFKPHPHLREHLYKHSDWGKERTNAYYAQWDRSPNTFLVDSDYTDLFKTSDALIHDCGSFTVEYLFMNKPVLYIGNERSKILCQFGKLAMDANYTLLDTSIENFIEHFVSANSQTPSPIDTKNSLRKGIVQKYLLPPNGKSFAQNIYTCLLKYFNTKS